MGSASSKAQKAATRKYPSPSSLPNRRPAAPQAPPQSKPPFPSPSQFAHPADAQARLQGMPSGLDPNFAKRLQKLGAVSTSHPETKFPSKPDDMMTVLQNRGKITSALREEAETNTGLRKHVDITILSEIVSGLDRGRDVSKISAQHKVESSLVEKIKGRIAIPVDNTDGVGVWPNEQASR